MTIEQANIVKTLSHKMFSGGVAFAALSQEITRELWEVMDGISLGDENLLQRAGLFINRNSAEHRFNRLRRKVAAHIGERKALINAGNRLLRAHGVETVEARYDYGLSECRADSDPRHANTEWSDHMNDAYERMQESIEAVESDVSRCNDLLGELA